MEPLDPRTELARLIAEHREDYAGLSRLLGRNPAYIQQFIKRGVPRRLSEGDRSKLAGYFGVDETLLGAMPGAARSPGDLVSIQRFNVHASAGPGAFTDDEKATIPIAFHPAFLKQLCSASPADLSLIRVRGDSMSPTLSDGDDIMVDRSRAGGRLSDGIYVLRRDETLAVKRIAVHPGSRNLTISSDNPAYPTWRDCDPGDVDVIGRVVWAGRRIN